MRRFLFITVLLLISGSSFALLAQNSRNRAVIDSLRYGESYQSAEMFRRANRAQALDSTYYVGYLIEGYHYFSRAEEQTGLARAVAPLEKALALFEKEFGATLRKRYRKEDFFRGEFPSFFKQLDYMDLANRLVIVYNSLEQPDRAYQTIMRLKKKNLALDFESYHWLSWLFFRNRIFTDEQFPFLEPTIEGNLEKALLFADSLEQKHRRELGYIQNDFLAIIDPKHDFTRYLKEAFVEGPRNVLANTRGILLGYNLQPEAAARSFMKMKNDGVAKNVNLGYSYHANIDFRNAEKYFSQVPDEDSKSRGGHWQGYSSLFVFNGKPLEGAMKLREKRDAHGFTIGYGWDNLCLARMYLYAGQLQEARHCLDKAENFVEVHYNSSFREDQYRFMLKVLRLQLTRQSHAALEFEDRNYLLSWNWWKELPFSAYTKYSTLYTLANDLALNREREIVYYHIFHTENIITFDELWEILRHYNRDFFRKTFSDLSRSDPRPDLKRYYDYYLALQTEDAGDAEGAYDQLSAILRDPNVDAGYERLLLGRLHEHCARLAAENDWEPQRRFHLNELYRLYPQLIPFSGQTMTFRLQPVNTEGDEALARLLSDLKACNIGFDEEASSEWPVLEISRNGEQVKFVVTRGQDVQAQGFVDPARPDAGKSLAYQLFNIL